VLICFSYAILKHKEKQAMKASQKGSGIIAISIAVVIIAVLGLVGWQVLNKSNGTDSSRSPQNSSVDNATEANSKEPDIALQNIGLQSIEDVEVTTQAVREYSSNGLKGFYVFGDKLSGGRLNPNFEYASLRSGTKVVSAIDGVVGFIKEQAESKDSEVFIQPKDGSMWTVGYDHVTNVTVKKGSTIKAGDVIGEPAMQNNGLLRFEIQINKDENGATTHYCPTVLLANSVKEKYANELTSMQNKWEATTKLELYDVAAQNPVACLKQTLTPAEAEGR
jgi:hypothetical protein